jgi:DNA-binding MarR family transcriptional regulator
MEKRIGRLISVLYRKSQMFIGQALKSSDVTSAEYPILIALYRKNGITQEELSAYLYLDKSAVARVIQALVTKGFVTKNKDENDQRCNRIYLTEKGYGIQPQIEKALNDWNAILMMGFGKEKEERIYEQLLHMVANVKEEFIDKSVTDNDLTKRQEIKDGRECKG